MGRLQLLAFLLATIFFIGSIPYSDQGTCGLTFVMGEPVVFDDLKNQETGTEKKLTMKNSGATTATLIVKGEVWKEGTDQRMPIGATKWEKQASVDYGDKTPLLVGFKVMTISFTASDFDTYWQLKADLDDPAETGDFTQVWTFNVLC